MEGAKPCTLEWRAGSPGIDIAQTKEQLYCTVYRGEKGQTGKPTPEELQALRQYFQLDVSLAQLYRHWSSKDPHFQKVAQEFQGE